MARELIDVVNAKIQDFHDIISDCNSDIESKLKEIESLKGKKLQLEMNIQLLEETKYEWMDSMTKKTREPKLNPPLCSKCEMYHFEHEDC